VQTKKPLSPWVWVPSLYFAQGVPYVVVNTVAAIMYKRMGLSNTALALYTSWLTLPWVIKPLWSPIVDMFGTKRRWVLVFQMIMAMTLAAIVLAIPLPSFLQYTLLAFLIIGFCSATHDIAADGFYMLALEGHQQAAFAGVRNTFWRIAFMTSSGLMVMLAGIIESHSGLPPTDLKVHAAVGQVTTAPAEVEAVASAAVGGELRVVIDPPTLAIPVGTMSKAAAAIRVLAAKQYNQSRGFYPPEKRPQPTWWSTHVGAWWSAHIGEPWARNVTTPVENSIRRNFGEARKSDDLAGSIALANVRLSGKPEAGKDVVVVVAQSSGDDNLKLVEGTRLIFNESNWNTPAKVAFQIDPNLVTHADAIAAGKKIETVFSATSGKIPLAWSMTFVVFAVVFGGLALYHNFILPKPAIDGPSGAASSVTAAVSNFFMTFVEFFRKPQIVTAMAFLLLYRFGEAQLVKLVQPFLLDSRDVGGLGLTTTQVGTAYGTFGVAALTAGGLLGGYAISRQGLKFWLWPMIITLSLGGWLYLLLSYLQPQSFPLVCLAVAVEQFGYGFSFTAYILFMISVCEGKYKTAHYAICTGFMALSMMIPGMISGWLQEIIGYRHFFIWVLISTIPGFLVCALLKIDPAFGRRRKEPKPEPVAIAAGEKD
jgi:MFS transporter, PAT family, beta-lactamase induction signal transducer AmpG